MKAQCCICSDLFDQDDDTNIAALFCGHTFHEACLDRWLSTSNTCPQCRVKVNKKQIVRKLYFDKADDYDENHDNPEKLINEVENSRLQLRKKEKEKKELEETIERLNKRVEDLQESKKSVESLYKREQTSSSCLRKQLSYYESQQRVLDSEREEYKCIKKKLLTMKTMEKMLEGCDSDVHEILQQHGEGEGSLKQLATYCAVLKREYEKCKNQKKVLKDEIEKRRKEILTKDRVLAEHSKRVASLAEQLQHSENDLKHTEREREILKQKLCRRRKAVQIQSPCSPASRGSSSFVDALADENAIGKSFSTPVGLQRPFSHAIGETDIDLQFDHGGLSTDLAMTPDIVRPSPNTHMRNQCEENNVQFVKISSASDGNPAKRPKKDFQDISNLTTLSTMNIFKKKSNMDYSSSVRKGPNGLGGYTTFTQPSRLGNFLPKKTVPVTKKRPTANPASGNNSKLPAYPTLNVFLGQL